MSEMEVGGIECPKCKQDRIFLFSGSGIRGTCMHCGHDLPWEKSYRDFEGSYVVSYNG